MKYVHTVSHLFCALHASIYGIYLVGSVSFFSLPRHILQSETYKHRHANGLKVGMYELKTL